MPSRLDRYKKNTITSRVSKNKNLYQDIKNYEYIEQENIEPEVITISLSELNKDEDYKKEKRKEKVNHSIIEIEKEINLPEKNYDINKIMELAKKNRTNDILEEKRKLKKEDYNITNSIDIEKIDEIRKKKIKQELEENEEEIKDLINTIYSNTLKGEIESSNLFNNLVAEGEEESLATSSDTLVNNEINKAILEYEKEKKEKKENEETDELKFDDSFFTKSLEIKKNDLLTNEESDEMDNEFIDNNRGPIIKIIIFIVFVIIFLIASYLFFIK